MPQPELLAKTVEVLERAGIEYAVTGSIASSIQGEPRATHDIDLLVDMTAASIPILLAAFPEPDYFLQEPAIRAALRACTMFNLLSLVDGDKVDFWILTSEPFDRNRFARRIEATLPWGKIKVTSPEDTILAKLRWEKLSGGSEKQFRDALRIFELRAATLDLDYLEKWANELGVFDSLERLRLEARPLVFGNSGDALGQAPHG